MLGNLDNVKLKIVGQQIVVSQHMNHVMPISLDVLLQEMVVNHCKHAIFIKILQVVDSIKQATIVNIITVYVTIRIV